MSYPQRDNQGNSQQRDYDNNSGRRALFTPPPPNITRLHRDNVRSNSISRGSPSPRVPYGTSSSRPITPSSRTTSLQRDTGMSTTQPACHHRDSVQANHGVTRLQRDSLQVPSTTSRAPPGQKSVFQSQNDKVMASRQTQYAELDSTQRKEQDAWVASIAKRSSACLAGYLWVRNNTLKGYLCAAGNHVITDESVAEGKGACYILRYRYVDTSQLIGPWYRNDENIWVYCGEGIPKRNVNDARILAIRGESCGIPALGWIAGSRYEKPELKYTSMEGKYTPKDTLGRHRTQ